jgi:hypothetical protein
MAERSNTFARIRYGTFLDVQLPCFGVVHLVHSRRWAISIASAHRTTTWSPDGEPTLLGGCSITKDLLRLLSPTLVANLWDVTDRDIDKFSQAVFDKLQLDPAHVKKWKNIEDGKTSLMDAVATSRDVCKLKYLIGAAPVVYGIPFYL